MAFRYRIEDQGGLGVIVFRGAISAEEEAAAFTAVVSDSRLQQSAKVLAYKAEAQMEVTPEDVPPQIDLVRQFAPDLGRPRVAVVVSRDYDFGLNRMFELTAEGQIEHEFGVFRDLESACDFLELSLDRVRELIEGSGDWRGAEGKEIADS